MFGKRRAALTVVETPIDLERFAGKWFVVFVKPTPFERGACNPVETYTREDSSEVTFAVDFSFNKGALDGPERHIPQTLHTNKVDGRWLVQPSKWLPFLKLAYVVMDIGGYAVSIKNRAKASEMLYSYIVVGHPSRSYFWVMAREPVLDKETLDKCIKLLQDNGFDVTMGVYPKHDGNDALAPTET